MPDQFQLLDSPLRKERAFLFLTRFIVVNSNVSKPCGGLLF